MRRLVTAECPKDAAIRALAARCLEGAGCGKRGADLRRQHPSRGFTTQLAATKSEVEGGGYEGVPAEVATRFEEAIRRVDGLLDAQSAKMWLDSEQQAELALEEESWQDVAAAGRDGRHASGRLPASPNRERLQRSRARVYEDDEHSIRGVHIPRSAWNVLLKLRAAGHEGYIVGGAVRDLLLKGVPKDFDILTSASIRQVRRLLHKARVVGKRFPIVQVPMDGATLEVSSFSTGVELSDLPFDAAALLGSKKVQLGSLTSRQGAGLLWKSARQQNAEARDFTVNALMYDPFSRVIFDYTGGVADCRRQVLRTIIDPEESFRQDPARMMRAIRLAARAGLKLEEATARAIEKCSGLLLQLPDGRLVMEVQSLMAYGSSAPSMRLLWRHGLMELLFPALAAYLAERNYPRFPRKQRVEPLFEVLTSMDGHASPERPLGPALWVAIIASPLLRQLIATEGLLPVEEPGNVEDGDCAGELRLEEEEGGLHPVTAGNLPRAYRMAIRKVLRSLMDPSQANAVPKSVFVQAQKLLEAEAAFRLNSLQHVEIACGACDAVSAVIVSAQKPRCSVCGHALSSRKLKNRWPADMKVLLDIMQTAHE